MRRCRRAIRSVPQRHATRLLGQYAEEARTQALGCRRVQMASTAIPPRRTTRLGHCGGLGARPVATLSVRGIDRRGSGSTATTTSTGRPSRPGTALRSLVRLQRGFRSSTLAALWQTATRPGVARARPRVAATDLRDDRVSSGSGRNAAQRRRPTTSGSPLRRCSEVTSVR